jgi:hypothetical protein
MAGDFVAIVMLGTLMFALCVLSMYMSKRTRDPGKERDSRLPVSFVSHIRARHKNVL